MIFNGINILPAAIQPND